MTSRTHRPFVFVSHTRPLLPRLFIEMHFAIALSAFFLPLAANAQYGYAPPSPTTTGSTAAAAAPSAPASSGNQINV